MNDLRTIIKTIVTNECDQDNDVIVNDSFILNPFALDTDFRGEGAPQELIVQYQLDVFFTKKGELISKSKQLVNALSAYPLSNITYNYESNARLWRGTITIEKI